MKGLAGVGVLVAITLAVSAWLGSGWASAGVLGPGVSASSGADAGAPIAIVSSSRLILRGRVRCTASVGSEVQAGQAVSVKFVLRNVSKRSIKVVALNAVWLVVRAADGTTYDTRVPDEGETPPGPIPIKVRPRARLQLGPLVLPVRWSGPLQITPECEGKPLPSLPVAVTAPGPPPDQSTAIDDVVAASGHLLDHCRPQTPGVAVDGQIDPPSGNAPSLAAACSISIDSQGTFWVAQLLLVTPPGLPGVAIQQPYELFVPPYGFGSSSSPPPAPPYQAIVWQFVVTQNGALPVAAAGVLATTGPSTQSAPWFNWNGTAWQQLGLNCGASGRWWGGIYPEIVFISACPS